MTPNPSIAVIGLGYVGLPLATAFSGRYTTIGFDISEQRIAELSAGYDRTGEIIAADLAALPQLQFTDNLADLESVDVYIITVPTPVCSSKQPNMAALRIASEDVASVLSKGALVIYESTVYPGATEEVCVPILEKFSGLGYNTEFFVGYSPERINPGDSAHGLSSVVKVTAGSTPEVADYVDRLYQQIIPAGTHRTSSIRVAEAAKVIENTQRDLNIALVNEFALIFNKLELDTQEILEAAATKWNFLPFRPGLVGGHCIGVDPYYLTHKAQQIGYHPRVILSGREINDGMGQYVAESVVKLMTRRKMHVVGSSVLIMGVTFKENCPDTRNSGVINIVQTLQQYQARVDLYDPWADPQIVYSEYGLELIDKPEHDQYDAIIIAVGHREFCEMQPESIREFGRSKHVLYDVKGILPADAVDQRL